MDTTDLVRLLSLRHVAEQLSVSESTVRRWAMAGALPSVKVGGRRLVRADDLLRFIESAPLLGKEASAHTSKP